MSLLLGALLLFQAGVRNDIQDLRQFLGQTYGGVVDLLNAKNQFLLNNTQRLAPAQAAKMRAQMQVPATLPPEQTVLSTNELNVGQGLVTFLFEDDFIVERVNFVFCPPADPTMPARVAAVQVLFDDSRAVTSTLKMLQAVYQMPPPIIPGPDYKPQLMYPLQSNLPVTIWDLGTVEAVYQAVPGRRLIDGQLWLTAKNIVMQCADIPKLPTP
ncbi:MAG TPA: hypothetical protein VKY31_00160 [Terriglobia bacterium]|nr:hypothetical protein [Terriglobia bacterium]